MYDDIDIFQENGLLPPYSIKYISYFYFENEKKKLNICWKVPSVTLK